MVKRMRYGISVFDLAIRDLLAVAQTADACGFDSIWIGEHLMLPVGYRSRHPTDNDRADVRSPVVAQGTNLLDPWVGIGAIGQATRNIRVATGVYLLPLRHPLLCPIAGGDAR
jgi:alkanesulfonate monooxygenase SsuD/methylene tetrahydromethanopterin reductase-like flavin-dependent oxidoreductase (luciferase family)